MPKPKSAERIAPRLLAWFDRHGRNDLPWQSDPTPYRVWVSEIMLQQTQVKTVRGYFARFMERFEDVDALAAAPVDDVLHLWSGLGYYARARNLHRAAQIVCTEHGGNLPGTIDALTALPGIGRSTAGAILSLGRDQRHPILDGNVKRVLTRYHALEGWPGKPALVRTLWSLAERHTPHRRVAAYTQAIMDLGATVCIRREPACDRCPLNASCAARGEGRQNALPTPRPKRERPARETRLIIVRDEERRLLLERRPPAGIWGGLWSFPECAVDIDAVSWCVSTLGAEPAAARDLAPVKHGFTHFELTIRPTLLEVRGAPGTTTTLADRPARWHTAREARGLGLSAPVSRLVDHVERIEAR